MLSRVTVNTNKQLGRFGGQTQITNMPAVIQMVDRLRTSWILPHRSPTVYSCSNNGNRQGTVACTLCFHSPSEHWGFSRSLKIIAPLGWKKAHTTVRSWSQCAILYSQGVVEEIHKSSTHKILEVCFSKMDITKVKRRTLLWCGTNYKRQQASAKV